MKRWRGIINFTTPAGAIREWKVEVEAEDAEKASEAAMRKFKLSRRALMLPPIVGFDLDPLD